MWFANNCLVKPKIDVVINRQHKSLDKEAEISKKQDKKCSYLKVTSKEESSLNESKEKLATQQQNSIQPIQKPTYSNKFPSFPYFKVMNSEGNEEQINLKHLQPSVSFGNISPFSKGIENNNSKDISNRQGLKFSLPKSYLNSRNSRESLNETVDRSNFISKLFNKDSKAKQENQPSTLKNEANLSKRENTEGDSQRNLTTATSGLTTHQDFSSRNKTSSHVNLESFYKEGNCSPLIKKKKSDVIPSSKRLSQINLDNLMEQKKIPEQIVIIPEKRKIEKIKSQNIESLQKYIGFIESLREKTLKKIIHQEELEQNEQKQQKEMNHKTKINQEDIHFPKQLGLIQSNKGDLSILQQLFTSREVHSQQHFKQQQDPLDASTSQSLEARTHNDIEHLPTITQNLQQKSVKKQILSFLTPKKTSNITLIKQGQLQSQLPSNQKKEQEQKQDQKKRIQFNLQSKSQNQKRSELLSKSPNQHSKEVKNGEITENSNIQKKDILSIKIPKKNDTFQSSFQKISSRYDEDNQIDSLKGKEINPISNQQRENENKSSIDVRDSGKQEEERQMKRKESINRGRKITKFQDEQRAQDAVNEELIIEDVVYNEQEQLRIDQVLEEKKRNMKKEKYEEMLERINHMKEVIRKNEEVFTLAEDLAEFLLILFQQVEITKRNLEFNFKFLIFKKPHFKYVLKSAYLATNHTEKTKKPQLEINNNIKNEQNDDPAIQVVTQKILIRDILRCISSFEFLLLNIERENIIKQAVITDIQFIRDKIIDILKAKRLLELNNLQEGILHEENSINKLHLNLFFSKVNSITHSLNNEECFHQQKYVSFISIYGQLFSIRLFSDITHTIEPLDLILDVERRLGSMTFVKNSGRIQSKQIQDIQHQIKEKKAQQKISISMIND